MGIREGIYGKRGYSIHYEQMRAKYRGGGGKKICWVSQGGEVWLAFQDIGHYQRIMQVQDDIPHMAKFSDPCEGHILIKRHLGQLLWNMNQITNIDSIAQQITQFAEGTRRQKLVHGDVRPWNIIVDAAGNATVIDWDKSGFVDDLTFGSETCGVLRAFHPKLNVANAIDADPIDADRVIQLMLRQKRFGELWSQDCPQPPPWSLGC